MILWMAWSTLVSLLLGFAALAAERPVRRAGRSARGVWGVAILGSVVLQAWALFRTAEAPSPNPTPSLIETASLPISVLTELQAAAVSLPVLLDRYQALALSAWATAAAVAVVALLGGLVRLDLRARGWTRARVAGEEVRISEDFGPALFGLRSPTIVLPRWALALPPDDLRLACLHEAEHRRACDTWLLFAAALVAALTPWNAALWWNVRRLRAAVEIDCDARVLSAGASPGAYGALLLELTSSIGDHRLPVASFARPPSLLERRLTMIVNGVSRENPVGSLAALALCALLVVVACETPPPTALQEQNEGAAAVVAPVPAAAADADEAMRVTSPGAPGDAAPLIYVDGVRIRGTLPDLDPASIERIEVLKGGAAKALFGDEAAAGVVQIFLKPGAAQPADTPKVFVDGVRFLGDVARIDKSLIAEVEVVKSEDGSSVFITLKERDGPS